MATIPDIIVPSTEWVNLNTLSGKLEGSAIYIQNKGAENVLLIESATQPADNVRDGQLISRATLYGHDLTITSADTLWVKASRKSSILFVK